MVDEAAEERRRRVRDENLRIEEIRRHQREFPWFRPEEEENAAQMQFRVREGRQEALNDDMVDEALEEQVRLARERLGPLRRRGEAMRREMPFAPRLIQEVPLLRLPILRGYEMGREEARRVTDVMIEEAQNLKEEDENNPSSTRYSRHCIVCASENPRQRAVYTQCGHIVCYSCAVDNARSEATGGKCVFCRSTSGFVKLFEVECEEEKKNDVIDYNQSMINPDSTETADSSSRIPFALLFNGFAIFIITANITMFLRKRT